MKTMKATFMCLNKKIFSANNLAEQHAIRLLMEITLQLSIRPSFYGILGTMELYDISFEYNDFFAKYTWVHCGYVYRILNVSALG